VNELDRWVYFDGPEPESLRPVLAALRDLLPPPTEEDEDEAVARVLAALDAELAPEEGAAPDQEGAAPHALLPEPEVIARAGQVVAEPADPVADEVAAVEAPPPAAPPVIEAPSPPAPAPLAGTGMALELPPEVWKARGELPFRPPSPNAPRTAKTQPVPVMRPSLSDTRPLGDTTMERTVAMLPFAGNTVGTGIVPFPRLTLVQYASLCVELWLWPQQRTEIFKRYHVLHEAAYRAMNAHWQEVFAAQPEERAAYESTAQLYEAYLRGGGR
jgi:hypothetical protein